MTTPQIETKLPLLSATNIAEPELELGTDESPKYRKWNSLLTYQEQQFYRAILLKVFSPDYAVFAKVRLGDLVKLANEPTDRKFHSNQVNCKHIDFILCDKLSLEPLIAIELDDSSHNKFDRQSSDEVKSRVCEQAELPLIRVQVQKNYLASSVIEDIRQKLPATSST